MQSLALETIQKKKIDQGSNSSLSNENDVLVSFVQEIPVYLKEAMSDFIDKHPNWDQYRIIQAAIAGFLMQNGFHNRKLTRLYVGNMFAMNFEDQ